jgi:D-lactate dehydrogenase (cytochrome)
MLLMEFHGSPAGVQEQVEVVQAIATELGGQTFEWAKTPEERTRLWTARHNAYFAGVQSVPRCKAITTDTCVPISQPGRRAAGLGDGSPATAASAYFLVGHVGDGNSTWAT